MTFDGEISREIETFGENFAERFFAERLKRFDGVKRHRFAEILVKTGDGKT